MHVQNVLLHSAVVSCRAVLLWLASGVLSMGYAQVATNITPTVGAGDLGTTVTQAGPRFDITGGTLPNNGPNLFHSYGSNQLRKRLYIHHRAGRHLTGF